MRIIEQIIVLDYMLLYIGNGESIMFKNETRNIII